MVHRTEIAVTSPVLEKEKYMKKPYEAPVLVELGQFRAKTGLLRHHGNDRLILSKN